MQFSIEEIDIIKTVKANLEKGVPVYGVLTDASIEDLSVINLQAITRLLERQRQIAITTTNPHALAQFEHLHLGEKLCLPSEAYTRPGYQLIDALEPILHDREQVRTELSYALGERMIEQDEADKIWQLFEAKRIYVAQMDRLIEQAWDARLDEVHTSVQYQYGHLSAKRFPDMLVVLPTVEVMNPLPGEAGRVNSSLLAGEAYVVIQNSSRMVGACFPDQSYRQIMKWNNEGYTAAPQAFVQQMYQQAGVMQRQHEQKQASAHSTDLTDRIRDMLEEERRNASVENPYVRRR